MKEYHQLGDDPQHEVTRCCDERENLIDSLAGYKDRINVLEAQMRDLQEVTYLLVFHCRRGLDDREALDELDQATDGTPMCG